jgi:hypothetical protein
MTNLRFYANKGCYYGRNPEPKVERAGVALRKGTNPTKTIVGDTKDDAWLRGRDGTAHPHFDRRKGKR